MSQFPNTIPLLDPLVHLNLLTGSSVGFNPLRLSAPASTVWPTANAALYTPFRIGRTVQFSTLWMLNGATAAGNVDLGIYSVDGTKLISTGSTAQAGTNTIQTFGVASTELAPGVYYFAIAMSSGTATVFASTCTTATVSAQILSFYGLATQTSALPLPANAIFASNTMSLIPLAGFTNRGFV